jgi:hypothetical protein
VIICVLENQGLSQTPATNSMTFLFTGALNCSTNTNVLFVTFSTKADTTA